MTQLPAPVALESLKKSADFRRLKNAAVKWVSQTMIVQGAARPGSSLADGAPLCRLGLTVTRHMGGAVQRNRIKRRFRAICREDAGYMRAGVDYVLIARKDALTAPYGRLRDDLAWCLRHVHRLLDGGGE